ncbi:hypothetical protein TSAR_015861, partial [Trichomalopsis sarcophagae]
ERKVESTRNEKRRASGGQSRAEKSKFYPEISSPIKIREAYKAMTNNSGSE